MKEQDKQILESLKKGDNEKYLSLLYKHSLPKIMDYIKKNNGSIEEAKDIFQDSIIVFINHVKKDKFKQEHDIDSFLYTVARNLWINYAKRKKRIVYSETIPEIGSEEILLLQKLEDKEKANALETVFDKIGDNCKKLLSLFIYDKLKLKEIASITGISNDVAVKSQLYRCRKKMAAMIKENPTLSEKLL